MPKKHVSKPPREMTRRQISRWQKENRLQRFIMLGGIIIVAAVLVVIGTGLYFNQFKPLHATVIKVGDKEYNMDYYIDMLSYYGLTQGVDYIPYYTDYAVTTIQQSKIVVDEAAKLDPPIVVSDEEVNQVIKERELSSTASRRDSVRIELLLNKLKTEHFDKQIPQTAEHRAVLAMFLESQSQADEITARLNNGEKFQDIAAELSMENTSKTNSGDFGWVPQGILPLKLGNTVLEDKVFSPDIKTGEITTVSDPERSRSTGYWLLKTTETKEEAGGSKDHPYANLLESQAKANQGKAEVDNGADFAELAKAHSQDPSAADNGGDQGFVAMGEKSVAVNAVLFPDDPATALEMNKVSDPVKDENQTVKGGVWLLNVTGVEADRAIDTDNKDTLSANKLNTWIDEVWAANQDKAESFLTEEQKLYAIEKATKR